MLQPLALRGKTLRNRIVFGAHTANMSEAGLPGPRHTAYYEERARGGAAMIVVESMPVHAAAVLTRGGGSLATAVPLASSIPPSTPVLGTRMAPISARTWSRIAFFMNDASRVPLRLV